MALHVHNVRTRRKEPFVPLRSTGPIGLYVCGLTVYDHVHIGHARTYVAFDAIRRWLEHRYPTRGVHHVQNVTDVDDKIIVRAKERGVSPRDHAAEWDARCRQTLLRAGIRVPAGVDAPHVTTSIPDILRFIAPIVVNGNGYVTAQGNVYFDVPSYDASATKSMRDGEGRACGYGSLSNRDFREMAAGTRKDVETDKRHPADFALWKAADASDHPDASWDPNVEVAGIQDGPLSGIARGRPGWHIECSLMSTRSLGDQFDLHGGGQDLIFPHHENEVAQSQAHTGKAPFVNVWLHTGFLNVEGEKMSKSLGNFIVLGDMLDELDAKEGPGRGAEVLRLYFLQTHYRSKIDFTRKGLAEAAVALERLERTRLLLEEAARGGAPRPASLDVRWEGGGDAAAVAASGELGQAFGAAMDDDFHTPGALAALFTFQRAVNRLLETPTPDTAVGPEAAGRALETYRFCARMLSLFDRPARSAGDDTVPDALANLVRALGLPAATTLAATMEALLGARKKARDGKDWKGSDAIRDACKAAGYLIEDTPQGQRWRRL